MVNRLPRGSRGAVVAAVLAALVAGVAAPAAHAQSLGSQRVGTSAGTFLKIGVGARAVAMGGAFIAIADDATAAAWNPAGLALLHDKSATATAMRWPTDINYDYLAATEPLWQGTGAVQLGSLSADIHETSEYYPLGTGRTFTYSDWYAGVSYARLFTDRLALGMGARVVHEDLGSSVGGPSASTVAVDIGSLYSVGWRHVKIGMVLTNFGPPLAPGGQFTSTTGTQVNYGHYSLPSQFKIGASDDFIDATDMKFTGDVELTHPADGVETFRAGGELTVHHILALRGGYVFTSDLPGWSAGAGFHAGAGSVSTSLDYAYEAGGDLGTIHVVSLGVHF